MARKWKVNVEEEVCFSTADKSPKETFTLKIEGLTQAQIAMIRCMLEIDYEVDPVADWGFKRKDGDLQKFRLDLAGELERKGF